MPKAFPREFRDDVVTVAREGEASIAQVAEDFGVFESCLQRWLKLADIEEGKTEAWQDCQHVRWSSAGDGRLSLWKICRAWAPSARVPASST